jgi:predicted lipoprotein with Yx(FWY)xxD motif
MKSIRTYTALAGVAAVTALALTACGGGGSSPSSGSGSGSGTTMAGETVSVAHVRGVGSVLVDSKGAALYSPAQEATGKVLCTGACTSIWIPLQLPAGKAKPAASSALMGSLGVVIRPGGGKQVTFDGRPLYRFAEDTKPRTVSGNGVTDSFAGKTFTWHVASTGRASSSSGGSSSNTPSSTSSGRAYGY